MIDKVVPDFKFWLSMIYIILYLVGTNTFQFITKKFYLHNGELKFNVSYEFRTLGIFKFINNSNGRTKIDLPPTNYNYIKLKTGIGNQNKLGPLGPEHYIV